MRLITKGLASILIAGSLATVHADPSRTAPEHVNFASRGARAEAHREFASRQRTDFAKAQRFARSNKMMTQGQTSEGQEFEVRTLLGDRLIYNVTTNENVAVTGAVDQIRDTRDSGLAGSGMNIGLWDAGHVRATHQEFQSGGASRAVIREYKNNGGHATFVAGTMGAAGIDPIVAGMAPEVNIHSWDWGNDLAEMVLVAAANPTDTDKLTVSNHSYGVIAGWQGTTWYGTWGNDEDEVFGQYNEIAADWDRVTHGAPYYLPFVAAGNDRNDPAPAAGKFFVYFENGATKFSTYNPLIHPPSDGWDQGGFDTLLTYGVAKNVMTVGAIHGGVTSGERDLGAVAMTSFSAWGPTDDGRVKPDLVVNGSGVKSTYSSSDTSYATGSGTSYAAPGAAGAALLLQEKWQNDLNRGAMRASTMKALLIHTADDLGNPGPDYTYGWGLLNAKAAVDRIAAHTSDTSVGIIREGLLDGVAPAFEASMASDGTTEIVVTIAWTDPEGAPKTGLNDRAAVLVNDLDLRLVGPDGSEYLPFVLDPEHPSLVATTGDNKVDNVEQVRIAAPAVGNYTLRVTHKGDLGGGEQVFSMTTSGLQAPLADEGTSPSAPVLVSSKGSKYYFELVFDQAMDPVTAGVGANYEIFAEDGTRIGNAASATLDAAGLENDKAILSVPVRSLPAGNYYVVINNVLSESGVTIETDYTTPLIKVENPTFSYMTVWQQTR